MNLPKKETMTRTRVFGSDVPFLEWMRERSGVCSIEDGIVLTDTDIVIHQYKTGLVDSEAKRTGQTRNIQALMGIEIKTLNAVPTDSQRDTLWKWHITVKKSHDLDDWCIRNFGWSFVSLSNLSPDDSDRIRWGRFDDNGAISWTDVDVDMLIQLLSFARHPDNFDQRLFRRHHKTQNLWSFEKQPLGFVVPVLEVKKS